MVEEVLLLLLEELGTLLLFELSFPSLLLALLLLALRAIQGLGGKLAIVGYRRHVMGLLADDQNVAGVEPADCFESIL